MYNRERIVQLTEHYRRRYNNTLVSSTTLSSLYTISGLYAYVLSVEIVYYREYFSSKKFAE